MNINNVTRYLVGAIIGILFCLVSSIVVDALGLRESNAQPGDTVTTYRALVDGTVISTAQMQHSKVVEIEVERCKAYAVADEIKVVEKAK